MPRSLTLISTCNQTTKDMSQKELDKWFNNLDSFELGIMFPGEYEEAMESADPGVNINTFVKDCKQTWKRLSKEKKEELYNEYK